MFRKGRKVTFSTTSGNARTAEPLTVVRTFAKNDFMFHELSGLPGALFITSSLVAWKAPVTITTGPA